MARQGIDMSVVGCNDSDRAEEQRALRQSALTADPGPATIVLDGKP
jgi:hypothetical protein